MDIKPFKELSSSKIIFFLDADAYIKAGLQWVIRCVEEFVREMDKASNNEIIKQTRFILDNDGTLTMV